MLEAGGIVCDITRVQTREDFVASLEKGGFDVILADYSLPSFDGMSALKIAAQRSPDVPFIFVSGTLGEELAIEALKTRRHGLRPEGAALEARARRCSGALREARERIERKRAEEAARAATARLEGILNIALDAIISVDSNQRIILFNQGAEKVFGYAQAEVIGRPLDLLLPQRFADIHRKHIEDFTRSSDTARIMGQRREVSGRRKDGGEFPADASISKLELGGEVVFTVILRDVTEQKRAEGERAKLEERLQQAEKMEAIGRLASGIAHDFNNVLGGIIAYGEMLFDEAPDDAPRKRYANNVLTAATRGRELVDQILAYTRSQRGKRRPIDVSRTVAETLELVRSTLPRSITLHPDIPAVPLVVMGDVTQLHQIVTNLCSNSVHAMKTGGALRVAITPLDVGAARALSHGTLKPAGYARLSVEDSGSGMDETTLTRIFEPFFTTKEVGRGTGLGLALVYAIVTDLGGAIDVKSMPGEGSTFSIYLPLADARAADLTPDDLSRGEPS